MLLLCAVLVATASSECTWPGKNWHPQSPVVETCAPSGGGGEVSITTDAPDQNPFPAAPSVKVTYSNTNARRYALFPPPLSSSPSAGARPARIAAFQNVTPCGKSGSFALAEQMVEQAAKASADMLVFAEEYFETCLGPANTTCMAAQEAALKFCAAQSANHKMWLVCTLPHHEKEGANPTNTAVVFNRTGHIVGRYDKMNPVYHPKYGIGSELKVPSQRGVQVFDSDFGFRFCITICNDIFLHEIWEQCEALGANLILWTAAWKGGRHVDAKAGVLNTYIVNAAGGCGGGSAHVSDITGEPVSDMDPRTVHFSDTMKVTSLDPERVIVHANFVGRMQQMLAAHPNVVAESDPVSEWYVLAPNVSSLPRPGVRALLRQYDLPTINELRMWNLIGVEGARMKAEVVPDGVADHPVFTVMPPVVSPEAPERASAIV